MSNSNAPLFRVLARVERGEGKSYFMKVGSAWAAKEGDGYNIRLDVPVAVADFYLRTPKASEE